MYPSHIPLTCSFTMGCMKSLILGRVLKVDDHYIPRKGGGKLSKSEYHHTAKNASAALHKANSKVSDGSCKC